jgi:hypothetical protein
LFALLAILLNFKDNFYYKCKFKKQTGPDQKIIWFYISMQYSF